MNVLNNSVPSVAIRITLIVVALRSHPTGVFPMSISRSVPPPMDVTKAIIRIPKISSFLRSAADVPDTAKENVPSTSMIFRREKGKLVNGELAHSWS